MNPPRTHRSLLSLSAMLLAAALLAVALGTSSPALAAKPKKPRITKIQHLGSFDEMPGSQVSFTLIKQNGRPVKAINVQVSGVSLFCSDANHNFSFIPYATTFPNMPVGRNPFGQQGFAVEDIPLTEFEWGYKRFTSFLEQGGRSARGEVRIRWEQDGGVCGGAVETWTSHAV
jgi:hypothetical protein